MTTRFGGQLAGLAARGEKEGRRNRGGRGEINQSVNLKEDRLKDEVYGSPLCPYLHGEGGPYPIHILFGLTGIKRSPLLSLSPLGR